MAANTNDHAGCIACIYKGFSNPTADARQFMPLTTTCELGIEGTISWGAGIGCPYFLEVLTSKEAKAKHKKQAIAKLVATKMGARTNDD